MTVKESENSAAIRDYLKKTNRPYSVTDLYNNLKSIPKSKIISSLNDLVEAQSVTQKTYGKQSVFCFNQGQIDVDQDELDQLKVRIKELQDTEVPELRKEVSLLQSEYSGLACQLSSEEAQEKLQALKEEIDANAAKLDSLKSSKTPLLSADELKKIDTDTANYSKLCKKYKRICMDVVNALSEAADMKPKVFMEEVGIELP